MKAKEQKETINHSEVRAKLDKFLHTTGTTQAALSKKLGLSRNAIANYKCGNYNLSPLKVEQLLTYIERMETLWKTPL